MVQEMADNVSVKLEGLESLKSALAELPRQLRNKYLLNALRKAAKVPLSAARAVVPVMSSELAAKTPYRTKGLLKRRLMVRTSKAARSAGNIGVFINVRPAAGAKYKTQKGADILGSYKRRVKVKESQRGAKSKTDPFYWRFVNFGTKKMPKRDFLSKAVDALPKALEVFKTEMAPIIQGWNNRK